MKRFYNRFAKLSISTLLVLYSTILMAQTPPETVLCKLDNNKKTICNFNGDMTTYFSMMVSLGKPLQPGVYTFVQGTQTYGVVTYLWKSGNTPILMRSYSNNKIQPDYSHGNWTGTPHLNMLCTGNANDCPYNIH